MLRLLCVLGVAGVLALTPDAYAGGKKGGKGKKKKGPDLEQVFKKLDTNGDGKIDREEFAKVGEHLKKKNKAADADAAKAKPKKAEKKLTKRFNKLDTDGNGTLSLDEFKKIKDRKNKKKAADK